MKERRRKRVEKILECYEKYNNQISSSIFFIMAVTGGLIGAVVGYNISSQQQIVVIILAILIGLWVGSIIGTVLSIVCLILLEARLRNKDEK